MALRAEVTLKEETRKGQTLYRMTNGRLSFLVNPGQGGAIVSFRDRLAGDAEIVPDKRPHGMCVDHFQSQPFPGEMMNAAYTSKIEKQTADECVLALHYEVTGRWRLVTNEKLKGLRLEKRFILRSTAPALECRVQLTAPAEKSKLFAYWQQNIFHAGGQYDTMIDKSFRPSTRGIRVKGGANWGHAGQEDWIRDFTDGWMALIDTKRKNGLVVLSEYDQMDVAYMNVGNHTLEPMYRMTYLPAGNSVEYVNLLMPVVGLDNIVAANRNYIAGYAMASDGKGKGSVTFQVVRSVNDPGPLKLSVNLVSVKSLDKVKNVGELSFKSPAIEPANKTLSFDDVGPDPLVIRVDVAGPHEHHFEEYFNGIYKWGENIQTDMASPVYAGKRPPQKFALKKPKELKIRQIPREQIWYIEGLMDDKYRYAQAAAMTRLWGEKGNTVRERSFVSYSTGFKTRLNEFPYDYEKLLSYDLIILGGAKRSAIGGVGLEMLTDYCTARGSMLVLGGPMSYGASELAGTKLVEHWPVEFEDGAFRMAALDDATIEPVADLKTAPFLEHLDFEASPRVMYVHKVKVKPWGKVVLQVGNLPFLVISEKDGQRVACVLGAPIGTPSKGNPAFWEWQEWTFLLRQLNWWLLRDRSDSRFRKDPDAIYLD
jgi:uncharacterized membrane protein